MYPFLRNIWDSFIDLLETVVIAVSIFFVVYLFAFQPHEVIGQSMDGIDNFHTGQYILTDKVTYKFRDPQRGEVVVFKYPLNKSFDYIKRIIGLPGEEMLLKDNKITIFNAENLDGFVLDESKYLSSSVVTNGRVFLDEGARIKVSENHYFVMGDNRAQSADSRTWGLVERQDIVGRSWFRYWPPNELGIIKHP